MPLPLPGDLAILFMGFQISLGSAHPVAVVLVAAGSATAGASVLYWISRRLGLELLRRFGHFIRVDSDRIEQFETWFRRRGGLAIVVGRMIPGLRIVVAIFAGLARVPYPQFVLYTAISSLIWASFFTGLGWYFGSRWHDVSGLLERIYANPLLTAIVGLAVGITVTRLYYSRRQHGVSIANLGRKALESTALPPPVEGLEFKVSRPQPEEIDDDEIVTKGRSRPDSNRRSPP